MARIHENYKSLELDILDDEDLSAIEIKAKALSLDECLDFLCIEMDELSETEKTWAMKAWKRGRASGIHTAADKMFSAMGMRGGGPVAMEYLKQMSGTFQIEATPTATGKEGFVFNVVMPDDS